MPSQRREGFILERDPRCFYKEVEIRFCDCDSTKRARIETVLRIMADIAGVAYGAKGYTHAWLWEHDSVFLVTRAAVRIRRMPVADETILVKTWENSLKGVQYYRDMVFYSMEGETLAEGQTVWVVVDPKSRTIQRPSAFPGSFDPIPELTADTLPPVKLRLLEGMEEAGRRKIVYSDIDGNNHTYNAVYAGIACDFLPPELFTRRLTDFRINFNQEALLGEELSIHTHVEGGRAVAAGYLGDKSSFECEFLFSEE